MKVLVTGAGGFIGSHTVEGLRNSGHDVVCTDFTDSRWIKDIVRLDITKAEDITNFVAREKPDVVFHSAGKINKQGGIDIPLEDLMVNVGGTINVLEGMRKYGCKKIVFTSSGGTLYGDTLSQPAKEGHKKEPMSPYALNKILSEEYITLYNRLYGIEYVILRYTRVYGPRQYTGSSQGVPIIFIDNILKGIRPKIYGDGSQTRDFIYISDVVSANLSALSWRNEIVNIGTQTEVSILEVLNIIEKILGSNTEPEFLSERKADLRRVLLDITHAKELGWEPKVEIEEGLKKTVEWYKSELGI